jgi:hypothetical protein
MSPQRVQRKRTKGWRMPEGAVYVGRGSKFGNPFKLGETQIRIPGIDGREWEHEGRLHKTTGQLAAFHHSDYSITWHQIELASLEEIITIYREYVASPWLGKLRTEVQLELAGKDLACWCPLDKPCHADVLLELANSGAA